MLDSLLVDCDERYTRHHVPCEDCTYKDFCPDDCEECLDYIHTPKHAPKDAPSRKYDCDRMADFYVCKYACRFTSEMIHALKRLKDLSNTSAVKVLSFGCGPCTDLLALDYLRARGDYSFTSLEYWGIDYSECVWKNIHTSIKSLSSQGINVKYTYQDICDFIDEIGKGEWVPDLVTFQYFLSDLHKHSKGAFVRGFLKSFAQFVDDHMPHNSYIVMNDINLGTQYGGGRDHFDTLSSLLSSLSSSYLFIRGRFCDDNARNFYYPRGYPYGEDSDGEFCCNKNFFPLSRWTKYSPFNTCASAQMLIKKEVSQ